MVAIARERAADENFVRTFAALRDSCRLYDGHDPEHGARAAELARQWRGNLVHVSDALFNDLCYALIHHDRGGTSADANVGTCWDADRLDLPQVGIIPQVKFFSTAAGRRSGSRGSTRGMAAVTFAQSDRFVPKQRAPHEFMRGSLFGKLSCWAAAW